MTHSAQSASSNPNSRNTPSARRRCAAIEQLEGRQLFALQVAPFDAAGNALDLANNLLVGPTGGITITGATYVGEDGQAGTYTGFDFRSGANRLAINDGVLLTTGNASSAPGNQNRPDRQGGQDDASGEFDSAGDPDLDALLNVSTSDANSLTINFTAAPGINSVLFDFIFGSEEFPDFVGAVNDAFAAYLDGVQISFDADQNPITVNNNFFQFNNSGLTAGDFTGPNTDPDVEGKTGVTFDVEYDGLTPVIRTQAPLTGTGVHTLKFVVADAGLGPILDAILDSGVFLSRFQGSGAVIPEPQTDFPMPGVFDFDLAEYRKGENEGFVTATIVRTTGQSGLVTVDLFSTDGSASGGLDYTPFPLTTITFLDQQTTQTVSIPILDDGLAEGDENFTLTLNNPTNGAGAGADMQAVANVIIVDNEFGVRFSDPEYLVQEGTDTVQLTITAVLTSPSPLAPVSIDFATIAGGSATAGVDYTPTAGTLVFAPGETAKTFTIDILDDYIVEGADLDGDPTTPPAETINLAISNPSSPYILGLITRATVVLFDLDRAPAVLDAQFATNERFINGVALRYSEAMTEPTVEDLKNYDIYLRKESKRLGGSATRTRQEIVSAVYNEETRTVTLTTKKALRENKVYEVVANTSRLEGVESVLGDRLDGNYDNVSGDDFVGYLSRATRIKYFEVNGDEVGLQLKGPGRMELFRHVERDARILRMIRTSQDTILTGTYDPVLETDGRATIEFLLTGSDGVRNKLPSPFSIRQTIAGTSIPNT
jgi:hypothetical protein